MTAKGDCPLPPGSTVWAYLRDSGGDRQDRSVEQQQEVIENYCAQHGLVLERTYSDAARSGDSADQREALWRMLADISDRFPHINDRRRREEYASRINHGLIFWTYARLGRDRQQSAFIKEDTRMRGIKLISIADDLLTGNPDLDPIMEEVLALKSQLDLDQISKEAKRGLHHFVSMRDTD